MSRDLFGSALDVGIIVIVAAIYVPPFVLIFRRTGHSGWWGLLMLVPLTNIIVLWTLALIRWPLTVTKLQTEAPPGARFQGGPGTNARAIEIARREGVAFRSVRLTLEADGAIKMDAQDIGPEGDGIWGDDEDNEYEFWTHVEPAEIPKLAFEVLREKFADQLGAVDAFRDWCEKHGVEHKFGCWV